MLVSLNIICVVPLATAPTALCASQKSRFHAETGLKVVLKQLFITIGQTELVEDSHLQMKADVQHALVTNNGVDNSTLSGICLSFLRSDAPS
jgi:ABC-type transport system involved in cytochrome bd biosynthesis fused ATPase/permease subunit